MRTGTIVVILTVAALAGCGDKASPTDDVRSVVTRFGEASAKKDYQQICDELLARTLVENVEQLGLPCELAIKQGLGDVKAPKLTIGAVTVKGADATARVTTSATGQIRSTDTLRLRRDGKQWRIAALS